MPTLVPFHGLVSGAAADEAPAIYRYVASSRADGRDRECKGFVALLPVDARVTPLEPPAPAAIPADLTTSDLATELPVVTYDDAEGRAAEVLDRLEAGPPRADVTTPDGARHRLWALTDPAAQAWLLAPLDDRKLTLVGGHATLVAQRAQATSLRARAAHPRAASDATPVLVVPEQDHGLTLERAHWLVGGTTGKALERRLEALGRDPFDVREYFYVTSKEVARALNFGAGSISCAIVTQPATRFFLLSLRRDSPVPGAHALKGDDVHVIETVLLERLGLARESLAPRYGLGAALDDVREGRAAAAILTNPIALADARRVVAAGQAIPGGALALFPAPPARLLAHHLDPSRPL